MANKAFEYYKQLPTWAKGVVIVGGIAVTYIFASQIVGSIRRKNEEKKQLAEVDSANNDLSVLAKNGVKPTLSKSSLEAMSSAIIDAVNGCGTSNDKVYAQFQKVSNDADVLAFITTFGLRKKQRCIFSDDARESFYSQYTPAMSLSAHLQSDMSQGEINKINKILASKKIKYQF